jgi:hypothetical protein
MRLHSTQALLVVTILHVWATRCDDVVAVRPKNENTFYHHENRTELRGTHSNVQGVVAIKSVQLYDAVTDTPILNITNHMEINLQLASIRTTSIAIVAETSTGVESVLFGLNSDINYNIESNKPYSMCRNDDANIFPCEWLVVGTHTITVTPYTQNAAQGIPGMSRTITFTITNTPIPPPVTAPVVKPISCKIPKVRKDIKKIYLTITGNSLIYFLFCSSTLVCGSGMGTYRRSISYICCRTSWPNCWY